MGSPHTVEVPAGTDIPVNFLSDLYGWDANEDATDNGDGDGPLTIFISPAPTSDVNMFAPIVDGVQENLYSVMLMHLIL